MQVLVIRFSAMGDVALTIPVLRGVLADNENLHITFLSNKKFEPLFHNIPRFTFLGVDLKEYGGISGLYKLFKELSTLHSWDRIIDLHSVMRTWILGSFFKFSGQQVYKIDKGRAAKKALVRKKNKVFKRLPHTTARYLHVFADAGLSGYISSGECIQFDDKSRDNLFLFLEENGVHKSQKWIGIAPFSKHREKEWPLIQINKLITNLAATNAYKIILLGGGAKEVALLDQIADTHDHTINLAGVLDLGEEICLMHQLDCVIAMDSFNMHLAALCNTKVVSIWGATHYFAGFGPLNNNEQFAVEIPVTTLACRPCSVFGSKPCYRGDLACLNTIDVEQVTAKFEQALR